MDNVDAIVVGAGVVGLAIAARLSRCLKNVLVIDKNTSFGEETSSRNSEVIHAGIYYPKNSLKAKLCVQGKKQLYQYCQQRHIPHRALGKLLVAHNSAEEGILEKTINIAKQNGVDDLTWLSSLQIKSLEPELSASSALFSPSTGIIDVHSYMQSLLTEVQQNNGLFVANTQMLNAQPAKQGHIVELNSLGEKIQLSCKYLINSAGLHSTQVAEQITGLPKDCIPKLHLCRGHYFSYSGNSPFKHLVYPVPEAHGLGIHASLDMAGQLKFGPDTQYIEQLEYGVAETLKAKFVNAIKLYFPNIDETKLQPAYSGIRPKLQGKNDDVMDFTIQGQKEHGIAGLINLFGIDSPGLTSSLAIAEYVLEMLELSDH